MTTATSDVASYDGASHHYLSPDRRDPVKQRWEEPVNHRILASALSALPVTDTPLRVLDVGAGTGDGLALLEQGLALTAHPDRAVSYVGLDPDPEMVETASQLHADYQGAEFLQGDIRQPLPDAD